MSKHRTPTAPLTWGLRIIAVAILIAIIILALT